MIYKSLPATTRPQTAIDLRDLLAGRIIREAQVAVVPPEKSIRQAKLGFRDFPEHNLSNRKTFLIITQRRLEGVF